MQSNERMISALGYQSARSGRCPGGLKDVLPYVLLQKALSLTFAHKMLGVYLLSSCTGSDRQVARQVGFPTEEKKQLFESLQPLAELFI